MTAERYPYSANTEPISMKKYIGRYVAVYIALGVVLMLIFTFLNLESPSVIGFLVIFCSAQYAGFSFYKEIRRMPDRTEKRRFGVYAMLVSLALALTPLIILAAFQEAETMAMLEQLPPVVLGVALIISVAVGYWLSAFGFGQGAKLQEKGEIKIAKRNGR